MDLPETLYDLLLVFLGSGLVLGSLGVVLLPNPIFMTSDHRTVPLPFCLNGLFYFYGYGGGAHSIFVFH